VTINNSEMCVVSVAEMNERNRNNSGFNTKYHDYLTVLTSLQPYLLGSADFFLKKWEGVGTVQLHSKFNRR
jgi:hypothetical protein